MNHFKKSIFSIILLGVSSFHAQAQEIPENPSTTIMAGALLFGTTPMGCHAAHDVVSISKIQPFVGDRQGKWVEGTQVKTVETVNNLDITMNCKVSAEVLSVTFSAQGYDSLTYTTKWE